jgi:hypothetical protein
MYRLSVWPTRLLPALLLWAILSICADARGSFEIISSDVTVDAATARTNFSITFNQPPDFFGADALGRANNAFQYFYDAEPGGFEFSGEDVVVIRGPEIRFGNGIPVRDSLNSTGETFPNAEGWGTLRGMADYEVDGSKLSFTFPWRTLNESNRRFSYRLIATERGELTSDVSRVMIPLHPAVWGGLGLLGCAWIAKKRFGCRWGTDSHR